jgi:hypothetical protein
MLLNSSRNLRNLGFMHPKRLFVVLARRLVQRHPFTRRRKQHQRSTAFWETDAGTFSTSRPDVKLISFSIKNQIKLPKGPADSLRSTAIT